jgi:hypothetical protein
MTRPRYVTENHPGTNTRHNDLALSCLDLSAREWIRRRHRLPTRDDEVQVSSRNLNIARLECMRKLSPRVGIRLPSVQIIDRIITCHEPSRQACASESVD